MKSYRDWIKKNSKNQRRIRNLERQIEIEEDQNNYRKAMEIQERQDKFRENQAVDKEEYLKKHPKAEIR